VKRVNLVRIEVSAGKELAWKCLSKRAAGSAKQELFDSQGVTLKGIWAACGPV